MKNRQTSLRAVLTTLSLLSLGVLFTSTLTGASTAYAAELTTWQKFVEKKCSGSSGDAAERCASDLAKRLKNKCGAEKDNQTYIKCWRTFIKDNGGAAGPNSTPFEEEKSPDLPGSGSSPEGCGGIETSIVNCDDTGGNPIISLLLQIVNFLAVGVGIAVVGGIIWGGMTYASSNGDSSKIQQGKMIIVNAVLGLVLFIFMYAFINYLVPGGLFT